jgi:SatD family protein
MATGRWQVIIADLRASRDIAPAQRKRVDTALRRAMASVRRRFRAHIRSGPELLKGDELQIVLRPEAPALALLTYLRARFAIEVDARYELRAGLGRGRIERLSPKGPFASDGEAFHRAREALDAAHAGGGSRRTGWKTGDPSFEALAESMLGLTDALWSRWTAAQWEAVAGRLEGKGIQEIARDSGIRFQNVSKRLIAASWNEVHHAMRWLEQAEAAPSARRTPAPTQLTLQRVKL